MPNEPTSDFPADFVWGAATAAYQVEGGLDEGGRGESVWDRFCATPGKVRNGDSGAIACDFYHRYPQDVALAQDLGLGALRLSVAWPRILPEGRGRVSEAGLDFYDRLVDELLANGIEPFVTLYHWDLPQPLEDAGGWPERAAAEAFVEYVEVVARRLGDRVSHWITHNEPWVVSWLGYGRGIHAPGRASRADALATSHHLLLSHGLAAEVLRREVPDAEVGVTLNLTQVHAASGSAEDRAAAREVDGEHNRWFLDALFRAEYPADMLKLYGADAPPVRDGDLEQIATRLDFLGVNYYTDFVVGRAADGGVRFHRRPDATVTDMGWEVAPEGFHDLLVRLRDEYAPEAIHVTENGAAFGDVRGHDGEIRDPERRAYIAEHVAAIGRAIAAGVPVRGYFVWSLLDNFEWSHGYCKRFGIVYVDYPTLERIPKSSYYWYRDLIARHRSGRPSPPAPAVGTR